MVKPFAQMEDAFAKMENQFAKMGNVFAKMETRFFRDHVYSSCSYTTSRSSREVLIPQQTEPPKVSIPTRLASALRIQKVFRGFIVRKNMKKILGIKKEVDEIEKNLNLLSEPLKTNEMFMALLLQLDSVRGVRDCRKAVIKKVIMLQERFDAIVSGNQTSVQCDDQTVVTKEDAIDQIEDYIWLNSGEFGTLVEKNDLLIRMVTELCEKNKTQTQLINSLSKRVDNLERKVQAQDEKLGSSVEC